jgi:CHAT domain-containing protein/Tfp pilus assembly protein PilF
MKFGEPMRERGLRDSVYGYQVAMSEGTSIVCRMVERDAPIQIRVIKPDKNFAAPGDVVPSSPNIGLLQASNRGAVEPVVIVAERTGDYVLRLQLFNTGGYSVECSAPAATTDRDKKYARAQALFLEIRRELQRGGTLASSLAQTQARAALYEELGDRASLALSTADMAFAFNGVGDNDRAQQHMRRVLDIFHELNSLPDILRTLGGLAGLAEVAGNIQLMVEYYSEQLQLSRASGTLMDQANAYFAFGVMYHRLADETKARQYYERTIETIRKIQPQTIESLDRENYYHTNMANLVRGMNGGEIPIDGFGPRTPDDFRAAIEHLKEAFAVNRRMEEVFATTAPLHTFNLLQMANCYKELKDYDQALTYLNRFASHPTSANPPQRARVQIQFGTVYAKMGDTGKAVEYFNEVIKLLREGANPGNYSGYLHIIAAIYQENGNNQRALELYREALKVSRSQGSSPMRSADSLFGIAVAERELGNFSNSRKNVEEAIEIAESVRSRISADDLRTTYFSSVRRYYEFYTHLLMQTHKAQPQKALDRMALETSERARSRSLLDLLTVSGVKIENGIDQELGTRERTLREMVSRKADEHSRLILRSAPAAEINAVAKEVTDLTAEYSSVQAKIRRQHAESVRTAVLDSSKIQQLLDAGTVLLEYSLGEKKSYLWLISSDAVTPFELPGREELEPEARAAYDHLTARNKSVEGETPAQYRSRIQAAEAAYAKQAASLSEKLLGPVAKLIVNKRLVIVPDGALHYVSFAALPLPEATGSRVPVGSIHEVVSLPSASVLAKIRADKAAREPAPNMLAVFADPVFDEGDERRLPDRSRRPRAGRAQTAAKGVKAPMSRDFERAVEAAGFASATKIELPRLPFSRREAESIFRVSPQRLSLKRTDFDASKTEVFAAGLDKYRTVHFATHALLNSQHPELSGIVLSLVDKNGSNVDGYLRLHDIYNLKLNADLVVLSACSTALGKEIKGEGIIGLTRGFMYAGSPRVVASLWKVDDSATAALMTIFYRKMHVENLRPAAALRAAQVEMMKDSRWRSPYYWAPFVLHGEWR